MDKRKTSKTCGNCGNCDCGEYEKEIQDMTSRFNPMPQEEKIEKAEETVRRWKEKESQEKKRWTIQESKPS